MAETDGYWGEGYYGEGYWGEGYWGAGVAAAAAVSVPRFFGKSPKLRDRTELWQLLIEYLEIKQR